MTSQTNLIEFYESTGTDSSDRKIERIHAMSYAELESVHDYIQWLFPLMTTSNFNANSPVLNSETITAFLARPELRAMLLRSFRVMLRFYGLTLDDDDPEDIVVSKATTFSERSRFWLTPRNHNYLRLTRIMTSLSILGCGSHASALQRFLVDLYREAGGRIGVDSVEHCRKAV